MATVHKWSNVAVAMQSALASAKTIVSVTNAAPGVVTSTAHGYTNGDYLVFTVQGMYQITDRVFRVVNSATDTYQLEGPTGGTGIDTSTYGTFSSGTTQKITFGTSLTSITTMNATGGDFDFLDATTIHVNQKIQIPGLANAQVFTFDNIWDISDAGQVAMKAASDGQAQRAFKFTFGTGGAIVTFTGYVGFTAAPGGQAQQIVTSPAVITAAGVLTAYSA